jgi:hypothetical protein
VESESSAKRNSGRKSTLIKINRSSYIEKEFLEKSQNYCCTGDSRTQYTTHLEVSFHESSLKRTSKSNNCGRAAIDKLLIIEINAQMLK